jgi:hypothetical protein
VTLPKHPELVVPVDVWTAGNASLAISVAGLLAHKPELRAQELSEAKWERELAAYLKTPRP